MWLQNNINVNVCVKYVHTCVKCICIHMCLISLAVPPSASVTPKRSEQAVGGKAEFQCEVSGDPRPEIRWEKEGGLLPPQHQIRNGLLM